MLRGGSFGGKRSMRSYSFKKYPGKWDSRREIIVASMGKPWYHPGRPLYRWMVLLTSSVMLTLVYLIDGLVGSSGPVMMEQWDLTSSQLGLLYSAAYLPNLGWSLAMGVAVDKLGIRIGLGFTGFVIIGSVMLAFVPGFWLKVLARVVFGLGYTPLDTISDTVVTNWFFVPEGEVGVSPSLSLAYSVILSMTQLGDLLSFNLLPSLATYHFTAALYATIGAAVLCALLMLYLLFIDLVGTRWLDSDSRLSGEEEEEEEPFRLRDMLSWPLNFWLIVLACFFSYASIYCVLIFAPDLLSSSPYNYSDSLAGVTCSIPFGVALVFSPVVGLFLARFGRLAFTACVGTFINIVGTMLLVEVPFLPEVSLLLIGIGFSMVPASLWPCVSELIDTAGSGTAFSFLNTSTCIGLLLFPYFTGYIADSTDSYRLSFWILSGLMAVGLLLVMLVAVIDLCGSRVLWNAPSSMAALVPLPDGTTVEDLLRQEGSSESERLSTRPSRPIPNDPTKTI